jgi:hypothetical protein
MSLQDPELHVDDEPEEELALDTGEDEEKPESNGLAVDPYADDLLIGPRPTGISPWLLVSVAVAVLIVALIVVLIVLRTRG